MKVACVSIVRFGPQKPRQILMMNCGKGRGITLPGGKFEEGVDYTYRECVARETLEETGIILNPMEGKLIFSGLTSNHNKQLYVFLFEQWKGKLTDTPEGQPFWSDYTELVMQGKEHKYRRVYDLIFGALDNEFRTW